MKYRSFPDLPIEIEKCYNVLAPRRLKRIDLRSLEWDRLADWMQDISGEDEFRELLPRFFELAWEDAKSTGSFDNSPLFSIYLVSSWPEHEREAIEACFMLFWRLILKYENGLGAHEMLWSLSSAQISWIPFLDAWLNSSVSTCVLARALDPWLLQNMPAEAPQWLSEPIVAERIQADFFKAQDEDTRMRISQFEQELAFYCPPVQ